MNKIDYILSNGATCKECGSSNLMKTMAGSVMDKPLTRLVACGDCGAGWRDLLIVGDVVTKDGDPIDPGVLPLNLIFKWRWLVHIVGGLEPTVEGPYRDHDTMWAAAFGLRHLLPDHESIFEAGIDMSTGKMFFTELDFSAPAVGDACRFTVGCGGYLGKNDDGIVCPQCGLGIEG